MESFLVEVTNGIALVTLNRPEKLNALLPGTYEGLRNFFGGLDRERSIRAVVLTGAGRGFCSGGDLHEIVGALARSKAPAHRRFTTVQNALARNIRRAAQPVIAAVNGIAMGGGATLALACDLRIASPEAQFAFSFPGLAAADMGACHLLPRTVGLGRASEWLLTGRRIGAAEAAASGLVSRIVPQEVLVAEARATALRISDGPREALAVTKRLLDAEADLSLEEALSLEAREQAALMARPDFLEAYRAFVEKREPRFDQKRGR